MEGNWYIYEGDCLEVLKKAPDCYFDSMVTDPPAGISFMGREWDSDKGGRTAWVDWMTEVMKECYRVLKPGAHAFVWAIPRTSHWTATALEDAGFEVRDVITHHFGCLSEDTEILLDGRWEPYHKIAEGRHALCYNVDEGTFYWQPIQETFIYDYADTAYRLRGNHTDQIVSRNHRCLVEREGTLVFELAETLAPQCKASVPVLEDVSGLLEALSLSEQDSGITKYNLLQEMPWAKVESRQEGNRQRAYGGEGNGRLRALRYRKGMASERVAVPEQALLQSQLSCKTVSIREGHDSHCCDRASRVDDEGIRNPASENVRPEQPGVERWSDILSQTRQLSTDQVRSMSRRVSSNGAEGWLCHGTSSDRGTASWKMPATVRGGASYQPRSDRQSANQLDAVQEQSGSQTVRGDRFTRTDLVTVEPIRYVGKVWCVRVPTGVFVARRNGQVFITGNSGFPKSQDVGKFIDKLKGAEREVIGIKPGHEGFAGRTTVGHIDFKGATDGYDRPWMHDTASRARYHQMTAPATEEAKNWDGWGTALKPATEHWILVRKPLSESSIARNILKWGTGALNIDACRVHRDAGDVPGWHKTGAKGSEGYQGEETFKIRDMSPEEIQERCGDKGRWPTNLVLTHAADCDEDACCEDCPVYELDRQSGFSKSDTRTKKGSQGRKNNSRCLAGGAMIALAFTGYGDSGGASRFFPTFRYQAKPSRSEREAGLDDQPERTLNRVNPGGIEHDPRWAPVQVKNNHPTVKGIELMKWLAKLITPPNGLVLDPFTGSGSIGCAAIAEGFRFVGIDQDPHYCEIARSRIYHWEETSGG